MFFSKILRSFRHQRLRQKPTPWTWAAILERRVPLVSDLSPAERRRLEQKMQIFLSEKNFEGCRGLPITEEIRVTVAANACLLALGLHGENYEGLESVVVYPGSFTVHTHRTDSAGVITEEDEVRAGEAWEVGTIVLAWDEILEDAEDPGAGYNLVLHEFAHWLDLRSGGFDGAPDLGEKSRYRSWRLVLQREYQALQHAADQGHSTLIDPYATTNPSEFFAVVTECFFDIPVDLSESHPSLYGELRKFYRQDPARRWLRAERDAPEKSKQ